MAAFTALALGGALLGGYLLGHRKKKDGIEAPGPVQVEPEKTPEQKVEETKPVSAPAAESANTAAAHGVAARTRRRAAAGNSGKAGGKLGSSQLGSYATGSPRSLLGS